ncbi:MAG: EVE domain-containing protein [Deltaproteobacteria bacterium]|nr:EVE domain-containing protein [Deltaproteobacteria bacterium]
MKYWLMKSDVDDYKISDLKRDKKVDWVGVRNYQARNFMRDQMSKGDLAFFYHSGGEPSGIAGVMKISSESKPDLTQFEKKSIYFDPKATKENPRWFLREVEFVEEWPEIFSLSEIHEIPECKKMKVLERGLRLSITPVTEAEWKAIQRKTA